MDTRRGDVFLTSHGHLNDSTHISNPITSTISPSTVDVTRLGLDIWDTVIGHLDLQDVKELSMACRYTHNLGLMNLYLSKNATVFLRYRADVELLLRQHAKSIRSLNLSACQDIEDLDSFDECMQLRRLDMSVCLRLKNISGLASCRDLTTVAMPGSSVKELSPLSSCHALLTLDLRLCLWVEDITPIAKCQSLRSLNISSCRKIETLSPLASLQNLQTLDISDCVLSDLEVLPSLPNLHDLFMSNCYIGDLTMPDSPEALDPFTVTNFPAPAYPSGNISPLANCKALNVLDISECHCIGDFTPLSQCSQLEYLRMDKTEINDLAPLAGCKALRTLSIQKSFRLRRITPLSGCNALQVLNIAECEYIDNATPLINCQDLKVLYYSRWIHFHGYQELREKSVELKWKEKFADLVDENRFLGASACMINSI